MLVQGDLETINAVRASAQNKPAFVAHRRRTIRSAYQKSFLDERGTQEVETLEELAASQGLFAKLWSERQNSASGPLL